MMKTADKREMAPTALRDVWNWKRAVYRKTGAMSTAQALDCIHAGSLAIHNVYGLRVGFPVPAASRVERKDDLGSDVRVSA